MLSDASCQWWDKHCLVLHSYIRQLHTYKVIHTDSYIVTQLYTDTLHIHIVIHTDSYIVTQLYTDTLQLYTPTRTYLHTQIIHKPLESFHKSNLSFLDLSFWLKQVQSVNLSVFNLKLKIALTWSYWNKHNEGCVSSGWVHSSKGP